MELSEQTTASVMAALNTSLNAWGTEDLGASNVKYWRDELQEAGMTDSNAKELRAGYCHAWDGVSKPGLQAFCLWIRSHLFEGRVEADTAYRHLTEDELRERRESPVARATLAKLREQLRAKRAAQRAAQTATNLEATDA